MEHDQALWLIDHASQVDKLTFKVLVILLSCLAVLASACRLFFRFRNDRTLHKDDHLVFLATVCLVAETCCVYYSSDVLYIVTASVGENQDTIKTAAKDEISRAQHFSLAWFKAYYTLSWLTIWIVKFSFLALFCRMVRKLKKSLTVYYWTTTISTGVTGIVVLVVESFLCNQPTLAAGGKCLIHDRYMIFVGKDIVCTILDIVTDLMIISIPICILRMSQLSFEHKVRIAMVLWLSCVCIVLSILRLAGGIKGAYLNCVWLTFILHCEAAVAVMAGSMPALRALYKSRRQNRRTLIASDSQPDLSSLKSRVMGKIRRAGQSQLAVIPEQQEEGELPVSRVDTERTKERQPISPAPAKSKHTSFLSRLPSLRRISLCPTSTFLHAPACSNNPMIPIMVPPPESNHDEYLPAIPRSQDRIQIHVTCECTVHSEEASLHDMPDFQEIGQREWVWDEERALRGRESREGCSTQINSRIEEERLERIREDPIQTLDPALLGRITSGMHI
ncbi:hypothetical protein K491DRAFT_722719 [Lophiostoma macrostomum CBS 122681]|uniref:Rhodopsin domain-containing protein n=1 Tax=Lophiostoma macrostomum CBS 122681 TaxID=1314788 RepID=A0A6A6SK48_9PLEO|nr:hypothetical protein K491DRAFT_722719 [Lophiostoma macrostomum CBS 122681]